MGSSTTASRDQFKIPTATMGPQKPTILQMKLPFEILQSPGCLPTRIGWISGQSQRICRQEISTRIQMRRILDCLGSRYHEASAGGSSKNHNPANRLPGSSSVSFADAHVENTKLDNLWKISWHKNWVSPAKRPGLP